MSLRKETKTGKCESSETAGLFFFLARLKKWWSETFPYLHSPSLRPDECPMLIGIMECVSREETDCSLVEYQTEILHCGDVLIPTNARSSLPTVLEALRTFRQEFIFHEKVLVPFNVGQLTGLCPDVLLEVSKYLYLDEIINAFSMGFLQVLREGYSPVHLKDPSQRFLQIIPQHLDPRQITSLHISDDPRKHMNDLSLLRAFDRLTSLTILSERAECPSFQTQDYAYTFHTSVDYSEEDVESYLLRHLKDLYSLPITHLRVRCTGECNNHFWNRSQQNLVRKNTTIVSVVVDAEYHPSSRHAHWCSIDSIDVIESALLFFESLVNVQQVRLSIHRYYPGVILSVDPWLRVVRACVHLQRVILELENYGNFQQFATDIEQKLRQFRPGLIFRIETR